MSRFVNAYSELDTKGLNEGEKPWCDMIFDLTEAKVIGRRRILRPDERRLSGSAMASTPRGDIGFQFELEPVNSWRKQTNDGLDTEWGCITLRSVGEPTDRLLQEYTAWFGLPDAAKAVDALIAPAVVIGGSAADFEKSKVHTKLFLHHANEDVNYTEVFLNIDLPAARVELREKDEDYRVGLVEWLQGRCGQPDRDWLR